jgi:malonyl-CoA/methylmalonyl-CoA synthetase
MQENLYALFESRFSACREKPFLQLKNGQAFNYSDLDYYSSRIAHRISDCGVRPGDRVMAQVEKSAIAVFLYLACLKAGAIYVPLNPAYQEDELTYLYQDAKPRLIVCSPDSSFLASSFEMFEETAVLTLDGSGDGTLTNDLDSLPESFNTAMVDENDTAAILYTSGTTGKPKGAMLSHRNLKTNAEALHSLWGFRVDDVLLHALPVFHTHGLFVAINTTILNTSKMLFLTGFKTEDVIGLLPRATVMMGVPTFYNRLLNASGFDSKSCQNMRLFISGSAPLTDEIFTEFKKRTGFTILERYGMTETNMISSNPLDGERIAGSVGCSLSDVEIRVCGEKGQVLGLEEIGDIEVRGPNVFKGYWRNPEKTKAEFSEDGFFRTGDVGYLDKAGYLFIVGRSKDLIISGGFNVYPKEVESVLDRIDGVEESAVVGVPHKDFGEGVIAIVTGSESNSELLCEAVIIDKAREQLAGFKVPKKVFIHHELPRNAMGKVEKARLRELHRDVFGGST